MSSALPVAAAPWILLMDGGVSTHLEELLQAQVPPATFSCRSLWSSSLLLTESGCQAILRGHRNWLNAGSDILTTVTYQCHFGVASLELPVSPERMVEMINKGVRLAQEAIEDDNSYRRETKQHFVVASSGCYGAALADGSEYTGDYRSVEYDRLIDFHRRKAEIFLSNRIDGLAIETIPCAEECSAVCSALKSLSTAFAPLPCCWISLACKDGENLNEGTPLLHALQIIRKEDPNVEFVHAIGVNCCDGAHIGSLIRILTTHMAHHGPRRGIVVYPNSGEEWDASNETWKEGTGCTNSDDFSSLLIEAVEIVKRTWESEGGEGPMPRIVVGGCCRTNTSTIEALRIRIDAWHCENKF